MERKKYVPHVPRWLRSFEDEIQQNVLLILDRCYAIIRLLSNMNGQGDEMDLEAARTDLQDALSNEMTRDELWSAVMAIRPQVLNGRLPVSITEEIAQARPELANALNQRQINFFRAVISGGEFRVREESHYFPPIPLSIRKEADVRLTTHPDNLQLVVGAYAMMAEKTTGHARTAIEAIIADIRELVAQKIV